MNANPIKEEIDELELLENDFTAIQRNFCQVTGYRNQGSEALQVQNFNGATGS